MIHISKCQPGTLVVINPRVVKADDPMLGMVFEITKNLGRSNKVEMIQVRTPDARPIRINALGLDLFDPEIHMVVI